MEKYSSAIIIGDNSVTVETTNHTNGNVHLTTVTENIHEILKSLVEDKTTTELYVKVTTPPTYQEVKKLKFLMLQGRGNIVANGRPLSWDLIKEFESAKNERSIEKNNCKYSSNVYEFIKENLGVMEVRQFRKNPIEYCENLQHKINLLGYDVAMSHDRPTPKKQAGQWTDGQGKHSYSRTTLDYNYSGTYDTDVYELVNMYLNSLYYFFIGLEPERERDKRQKDELYRELYGMTFEEYQNKVYSIKGYCSLVWECDNITTPLSSCSLATNDRIYSSNN